MPKSFSQWAVFNICPAKYKFQHVDKLPTQQSASAGRGEVIHNQFELFLLGEIDELPDEFRFYTSFLDNLRKTYAGKIHPEFAFSLTEDWKPVDWKAEDSVVRGKMDLRITLGDVVHIYDWKTGKEYDDHAQQKYLYAVAEQAFTPDVKEVIVTCVYIDSKKNNKTSYPKALLTTGRDIWLKRFRQMDNMEIYIKRPGFHCRYCSFSAIKGGPCEF